MLLSLLRPRRIPPCGCKSDWRNPPLPYGVMSAHIVLAANGDVRITYIKRPSLWAWLKGARPYEIEHSHLPNAPTWFWPWREWVVPTARDWLLLGFQSAEVEWADAEYQARLFNDWRDLPAHLTDRRESDEERYQQASGLN